MVDRTKGGRLGLMMLLMFYSAHYCACQGRDRRSGPVTADTGAKHAETSTRDIDGGPPGMPDHLDVKEGTVERSPAEVKYAGLKREDVELFLRRLKAAISQRNKQAVASLVAFPLNAWANGRRVNVMSEQELVSSFDSLFGPLVSEVIRTATVDTIFANTQGIMLGDGEIWAAGRCRDAACGTYEIKIISITNAPRGSRRPTAPR
ncbi:MAG: hypothetical protein SFV15_18705 [Polyangiaceae bacterium]|nr:hypothetical protein [Polyangiaceae bacterium]